MCQPTKLGRLFWKLAARIGAYICGQPCSQLQRGGWERLNLFFTFSSLVLGTRLPSFMGCYVVLWGNSKPGKQIAIIDANIAKYAGIDNRSITGFMFIYLHVS